MSQGNKSRSHSKTTKNQAHPVLQSASLPSDSNASRPTMSSHSSPSLQSTPIASATHEKPSPTPVVPSTTAPHSRGEQIVPPQPSPTPTPPPHLPSNAQLRASRWLIGVCLALALIQIVSSLYHWATPLTIVESSIGIVGLFCALVQAFAPTFQFSFACISLSPLLLKRIGIGVFLLFWLLSLPVDGFVVYSYFSQRTSNQTKTSTENIPTENVTSGERLYQSLILGKVPDWSDNLDTPDDPNGWSVFPGATACGFASGQYHASASVAGYVAMCFAGNVKQRNFAYQANMEVKAGDGGGIILRASSPNFNAAMYRFDIHPMSQSFDILVQSNNAQRTNRPCDSAGNAYCTSSSIHKTGKNVLAVIAQGNTFFFYVNGVFLCNITDTTLTSGVIGLFAVDAQKATDVAFDSAQIWTL